MKASDLRIGNFVKDRGNKVIRIDFMEYQESGYSTKFGQRMFLGEEEVHPMTEYTDYAIPIELTEEWLLKFGFKSYDTPFGKLFEFISSGYTWIIDNKGNLHLDYSEYENIANVQCVHQLQNLYFALTGKELEVKF